MSTDEHLPAHGMNVRKTTQSEIRWRLITLAHQMHSLSLDMLADGQTLEMQAKGVELQGAAANMFGWAESIKAEETAQQERAKRAASAEQTPDIVTDHFDDMWQTRLDR